MPAPLLLVLPLALLAAGPAAPAPAPDPAAATFAEAAAALRRDRGDPRGLAAIGRLHAVEPALVDQAALAQAYRAAAEDPKAHPEVAALARWRLAEVEEVRGNLHRAEAERARLGLVRGWWIAGPFDNEGRRGLAATYPPEAGIDLAARFPGKAREVGWRPLPPEAEARGVAQLGAVIRPQREVTVYALAVLDSPREQRVRLWTGASGALRAWVNGVEVLEDRAYHPARLDQAAVELTLRRGPNRLLVKVGQDQGDMALAVRLTDLAGRGLALPAVTLPPLPPAGTGTPPRPGKVETAVQVLARRAAAAKGEAEGRARMDLAMALLEKQPEDGSEHAPAREAHRAADLLPRSAAAQLLASRLEDQDQGRRLDRLKGALRADPANLEARAEMAAHEARHERPQEAVRILGSIVHDAPGWVGARVALAQARGQAGLAAQAELSFLDLAAAHPESALAAEAGARAARRIDRRELSASLLRRLLAMRFDDVAARGQLAQLSLEKGDVDAALEILAQAQRLAPADVWLRLRRADLLAANGHPDAAEPEYQAAIRIAPDEPDAWERRGRARLREGRRGEALADLQKALDLKPQSPGLKELVRQLEPTRERFEAPYLADARALAREAPGPRGEEDALVLSETKVTRVYPSGQSATYVQQVVKVFTPRGADGFRGHPIGYVPGRQDVRVERARVWKPDGTAVENHREADHSTSEPWYRLYYDTRVRQVSFPSLSPGDVLELAWRVDDVANENLLSDYFGEVTPLAGAVRKQRVDYVLLSPEGRPIYSSEPPLPGLERTERPLPGGIRERRWTARDVPRLEMEPGMPGPGESVPSVHVSTYATWGEVARFYEGLVREQLRPGPEVRAAAARIAAEVRARPGSAGLPEKELRAETVRAVHDWVVTNTRYVGLEFGIHGFKPYPVEQVIARRFGDCKDKASLTHALLESLGVDSRLVLLRMRRLGTIPPQPASLAVFNHAILYVPELDLWLDGTATGSGSREIPGEDRGATALVVNPGAEPTFGPVPEARPEDNRMVSEFRTVLARDGSATLDGVTVTSGARAPEQRAAYQVEGSRRNALERSLARTFPGLRVESVDVGDLSRLEEDVRIAFRLSLPRLARPENGGLSLPPFGQGQAWTEGFAPLSVRHQDLVVGSPFLAKFTFRHKLPAGLAAVDLPAPESREGPFGAWSVAVRADGDELVAEGSVRLTASRVRVADYPAFREFLARLDRALSRSVRLAPTGGTP